MNAVNRWGYPPFFFFFPPFTTDEGVEIGQEIFFPNLTFYAACRAALLVRQLPEPLSIASPCLRLDLVS